MHPAYRAAAAAVVRQTVRRTAVACAFAGYFVRMEREDRTIEQQGDYKNAFPSEVDDHPDSGMPRQLRTQADDEGALSRREADVAGISQTPEVVYGESDEDQNRDDQRDAHHGSS